MVRVRAMPASIPRRSSPMTATEALTAPICARVPLWIVTVTRNAAKPIRAVPIRAVPIRPTRTLHVIMNYPGRTVRGLLTPVID